MNQDNHVGRTRTITVRCTFDLPVEIPDDPDYDEVFDIEENHCPGTGLVGAALEKRMKKQNEKGFCWACGLNAKNEIL